MKTKILNLFFTGMVICGAVISGCSKNESINELKENPQLLSAKTGGGDVMASDVSILNQDLVITYASDNGADITSQFKDFTFHNQGTPPSGQAHVWNDLLAQTGTWTLDGEALITLNYPTGIFQQLSFLNRTWNIGESSSAVIRLYDNGDEVHLTPKK
jgi:hypothetical protein